VPSEGGSAEEALQRRLCRGGCHRCPVFFISDKEQDEITLGMKEAGPSNRRLETPIFLSTLVSKTGQKSQPQIGWKIMSRKLQFQSLPEDEPPTV
jgi:hypothetical protein